MAPTVLYARIMGPTLIALSVSEARNWKIFTESTPAVVYLNGTILFACGITVVQSHNVWQLSRAALVTGVGWFCLGLGLLRMIFPDRVLASIQDGTAPKVSILGAVGFTGGLLCAVGYQMV
ncbi:hypothetical protein TWF694_009033 [Orbilia ellipsospora]|uniref:Uncharacterized protein n=1 Tax=Orbilia ellipsospora TaxID=2528407 RepID=A0AAV9XF66_9PEZI